MCLEDEKSAAEVRTRRITAPRFPSSIRLTSAKASIGGHAIQHAVEILVLWIGPNSTRSGIIRADENRIAPGPNLSRNKLGYDKYQLISGERRFKASKMVGKSQIPAFIRIANDQQMLEMALVENIQRSNLNPIEIALSYHRLMTECKLTQEQCSDRVGKKRSTVANFLRLLKLPEEIQSALKEEKISMGHARALINVKTALEIAQTVVRKGLSVRETESIVRKISNSHTKESVNKKEQDPDTEILERELSAELGFPVSILHTRNEQKGRMVLNYKTLDDLDRVINIIMKKNLN